MRAFRPSITASLAILTLLSFAVSATPANAIAPGAPGQPIAVVASPRSQSSAQVTFRAPLSHGTSPITSYTATCLSPNFGATGHATGLSGTLIVPGLTYGKLYLCEVVATNASGSGLDAPSGLLTLNYASLINADVPTAYYRMDEASGTTAGDHSGFGRNLTYHGSPALNQPGAILHDPDHAVRFNGTTQYVSGTNLSTGFVGALTIETHVKFNSLAGLQYLVSNFNTKSCNSSYNLYLSAGHLFFSTNTGGACSQITGKATVVPVLHTGVWYDIAITRTNTNSVVFYINGARLGTPVNVHAGPFSTTLTIGSFGGSTKTMVNGTLDEVAIYHATLAPARMLIHASMTTH